MTQIARTRMTTGRERALTVARFGGRAELRVQPDEGCAGEAQVRLERAAALLAEIDRTLSRFDPASELSALNADARRRVPASPLMLRFAEAVGWAGRHSGGLVDATCLPRVEQAGYDRHLDLTGAAPRFTGAPAGAAGADGGAWVPGAWRGVTAGPQDVERAPGVRLDSGGIGKGLAADLAAEHLRGAPAWVVDCGGDLRIGGTARLPRAVDVRDPLDPEQLVHRLHVTRGAVATSGVTRRAWDARGEHRHHLIDPRTGAPADTGVVQVTALAPTALEAEVLAKTALLSGLEAAHLRLVHGGVVIGDDGVVLVVPPPAVRQSARVPRRRASFRMPGQAAATRRAYGPRP